MNGRRVFLPIARAAGAVVAYGALTAFVLLLGLQITRWFRDGEWMHIGTDDGLRTLLLRCCVRQNSTGRLVDFVGWLDAPLTWLGLHKVMQIVPASLSLFAVSILGNCLFIYCSDRMLPSVTSPAALERAPDP